MSEEELAQLDSQIILVEAKLFELRELRESLVEGDTLFIDETDLERWRDGEEG